MTSYYSNPDRTRLIATSETRSCIIAITATNCGKRLYSLSVMGFPFRKTGAEELQPISQCEFMAEYDLISATVIDLTINVLP